MAFLVFALAVAFTAAGVIGCGVGPAQTESVVTYGDGERTFEGVIVVPRREADKKCPAIVIAHDFLGLGDYQKAVAHRLADRGYVVLAADIYGQGVRPKSDDEANQLALSLRGDVPTMRRRMMAAYQLLTSQPGVDSSKVVALGYSIGGLAAFELARGGAQLAGVVSMWGILETKRPEDKLDAQTKALIFHGTLDPLTSAEAVTAFETELQRADRLPTRQVWRRGARFHGAGRWHRRDHGVCVPCRGRSPIVGSPGDLLEGSRPVRVTSHCRK